MDWEKIDEHDLQDMLQKEPDIMYDLLADSSADQELAKLMAASICHADGAAAGTDPYFCLSAAKDLGDKLQDALDTYLEDRTWLT